MFQKNQLDVFESGSDRRFRTANTVYALAPLVERWKECFVVFEATGHYDARLRRSLATAGIAFARVNPARARDFARGTGRLATTRQHSDNGFRALPKRRRRLAPREDFWALEASP